MSQQIDPKNFEVPDDDEAPNIQINQSTISKAIQPEIQPPALKRTPDMIQSTISENQVPPIQGSNLDQSINEDKQNQSYLDNSMSGFKISPRKVQLEDVPSAIDIKTQPPDSKRSQQSSNSNPQKGSYRAKSQITGKGGIGEPFTKIEILAIVIFAIVFIILAIVSSIVIINDGEKSVSAVSAGGSGNSQSNLKTGNPNLDNLGGKSSRASFTSSQSTTQGSCTGGHNFTITGLTDVQKKEGHDPKELVTAHNYFRQIVSKGNAPGQPGAIDMLEMFWSEEIAAKANDFADKCDFAHDTNFDRKTTNFPSVGQNLAYQSGNSGYNLTYMVELWYNEVKIYSGASAPVDSFQFSTQTGHYTQVVWAKSYALGCGFKVYNKNGWKQQLSCNYGPAGNVGSQKIYQKGSFTPNSCTNGASEINSLCNPASEPQ